MNLDARDVPKAMCLEEPKTLVQNKYKYVLN